MWWEVERSYRGNEIEQSLNKHCMILDHLEIFNSSCVQVFNAISPRTVFPDPKIRRKYPYKLLKVFVIID
jgi:hypothetical protein